jgi:hypothetical protein
MPAHPHQMKVLFQEYNSFQFFSGSWVDQFCRDSAGICSDTVTEVNIPNNELRSISCHCLTDYWVNSMTHANQYYSSLGFLMVLIRVINPTNFFIPVIVTGCHCSLHWCFMLQFGYYAVNFRFAYKLVWSRIICITLICSLHNSTVNNLFCTYTFHFIIIVNTHYFLKQH